MKPRLAQSIDKFAMTTILKMFGSGQVILPKAWRKQFQTKRFIARVERKCLVIEPLDLEAPETALLTRNPSPAFLKEEPDLYK